MRHTAELQKSPFRQPSTAKLALCRDSKGNCEIKSPEGLPVFAFRLQACIAICKGCSSSAAHHNFGRKR